jgi:hypothetical protein
LGPQWTSPHLVILTMPTAVKVQWNPPIAAPFKENTLPTNFRLFHYKKGWVLFSTTGPHMAMPLPQTLSLFLSYISSQSSSGSQFSAIGEFKTLIGAVGLIVGACTILLCFLPLVIWSIRSITEATIERKTAAPVMMLWKYKALNQENAL